MNPSIRMVCSDCLNSVEYNVEAAGEPIHCPICGGLIDNRLTDQETPTSDITRVVQPERNGSEVTPWTETWSKGTLGTIGRYQLRELLGDGGFGQVYLAYDPRLDRDVALKVLKMPNPGERIMQRFFREARAAARLQHPTIVGVYDAGRDAGKCWIAYQFIKGSTLARRRDSERLDHEAAVRIIRDLADALDYAHREGVYHRDLKPANIMIDVLGRPRLTDFGLARRADLDSDLTRDGAVIGTPAYMSPEQARGQSNLADERSDVFSLGVMLFELLCGQRPGNQPSEARPWPSKMEDPAPPPRLRSLDPTVPEALDQICRTALAPNPGERYPNARALADDLNRWLDHIRVKPSRVRDVLPLLTGVAAGLFLFITLRFATPSADPSRGSPAPSQAITGNTATQPAEKPEAPRAIATVPPTPPPVEEAAQFIGNSESKKYHLPGCMYTKGMTQKHLVPFASLDKVPPNYTPCSACRPPALPERPE